VRLPTGDPPASAFIQRAILGFPSPVLEAVLPLTSLFTCNPQVWGFPTTTTTL